MATKIVQCGYMSGDTYAAAALLAADSSIKIILVTDRKATGQHADKSGTIKKIYTESEVINRVEVLDLSTSAVKIKDLWEGIKDAAKKGQRAPSVRASTNDDLDGKLGLLYYNYTPQGRWPLSITAVTGLLANQWETRRDTTTKAIAKAWKVGKLPPELKIALYGYMARKFAKTKLDIARNVVVLWSRQSGKRGGAHLELDSSYTGIRQLARDFINCGKPVTVLLAGDERSGKLDALASRPDMIDVVNISDMWEDSVWKTHFGKATYLAQFAFFKYLAEESNVVHVGMRSGMLEAMALLGMHSFYLEGAASGSGDRMTGFTNAGITYTRIVIPDAPGLTGRISEKNKFYTTGHVGYEIRQRAKIERDRDRFQALFPNEDKYEASLNYAKAQLAGEPLDDSTYQNPAGRGRFQQRHENMDQHLTDVSKLRGFYRETRDEIVKQVVATFKP
jgi:hypothetical protein